MQRNILVYFVSIALIIKSDARIFKLFAGFSTLNNMNLASVLMFLIMKVPIIQRLGLS